MVYTGKPSTGCQRCRQRRKKCDENRPYCHNCRRLGRPCPGFPDAIDLMFRNETVSSSRRTYEDAPPTKRRRPSKPVSEPRPASEPVDPLLELQRSHSVVERPVTDSPATHHTEPQAGPANPTNPWVFTPTFAPISTPGDFLSQPEEQVFDFAQSDYDPQFSTVNEGFSHFSFGTSTSVPETSKRWDRVLYDATEAVALRNLSFLPGHDDLSVRARAKCQDAKAQLQHLVDDDKQIASDSELLAMSLKTLHEATTPAQRAGDWTQMLAMEARKRTTGSTHSWFADLADAPKTALLEHATRLPVMLDRGRHILSYRACAPELVLDVNALIDSAYRLQHDLFSWDLNMSSDYDFQKIANPAGSLRGDEVQIHTDYWPGPLHRYKSFEASSVRNTVRACQLLCCELLTDALKWLSPLLYEDDPRYKAALYRMQYLLDDIAASVPYHMGHNLRDSTQASASPRAWHSSNAGVLDAGTSPQRRNEGMYAVVWPLHVASRVQHTSAVQRRWFRARLEAIAHASREAW